MIQVLTMCPWCQRPLFTLSGPFGAGTDGDGTQWLHIDDKEASITAIVVVYSYYSTKNCIKSKYNLEISFQEKYTRINVWTNIELL